MEKSHSGCPRTVWCVVNTFHKNGMSPLRRTNGTIFYSILYRNLRLLYDRLKYVYLVISVIVDWLSGNTKKWTIDKFVAFGMRFFHSRADWSHMSHWVGCYLNYTNSMRHMRHVYIQLIEFVILRWLIELVITGHTCLIDLDVMSNARTQWDIYETCVYPPHWVRDIEMTHSVDDNCLHMSHWLECTYISPSSWHFDDPLSSWFSHATIEIDIHMSNRVVEIETTDSVCI